MDDYLAAELVSKVKHEYTGGYVYAMAGGRNVHNTIATAFLGIMHAGLRGKPCQPFNSDTKVRVRMPTHTRFYYPDGMVVCHENPPGDTFQDQPVVIAEVLSPTTRRTDEGEKRDAYLTIPTLVDYLLIETGRPRVIVHHRTAEGFVVCQYDGLDASVPLDELGLTLPLSELYERVDFNAAAAENDAEAAELET
ncbi:MAG TPA: Uma2 family endonuclease [Tepidisphaeraceae bacterium]